MIKCKDFEVELYCLICVVGFCFVVLFVINIVGLYLVLVLCCFGVGKCVK